MFRSCCSIHNGNVFPVRSIFCIIHLCLISSRLINGTTKEEFSQLLEKVLSFGLYDRIVLDLDELPFELEGILRKTSELYCVVPAEQGIRESYAIRSGDWQAFLKKLDLDPVNLMVKEWEYRVG